MNVLYADRDGVVHFGVLTTGGPDEDDTTPVLLGRGGKPLAPGTVLALLAPHHPTEAQNAVLYRAHEAGYRVEEV
ncbi:MAG TPA: hypothetical protein VLF66_03005 [Thermoanaerobaculia bacterium]|nr:hypothetical protein [Thermoanaerobaculia bacterium]